MKAVREIIDYLYLQGLLALEDLHDLDGSGLLRGTRAGEIYESDRLGRHDVQEQDEARSRPSDDLIDQTEAHFDRIAVRRTSKSGVRASSIVLSKTALSDRIRVCFDASAPRLRPLVQLASGSGGRASLSAAVRSLLASDEQGLQRAVAATLTRSGSCFLDLWDAATLRDFRGIVHEGEHGPATVAARAVLRGVGLGDLGRYVSEQTPALSALMRLIQVQRRILGATGSLLRSAPAVFDRPLFAARDARACYWALTMAITALQDETPPAAAIALVQPWRPLWEYMELDLDVFEDAVAMSRTALHGVVRRAEHGEELRCPANWNVGDGAWHPKALLASARR